MPSGLITIHPALLKRTTASPVLDSPPHCAHPVAENQPHLPPILLTPHKATHRRRETQEGNLPWVQDVQASAFNSQRDAKGLLEEIILTRGGDDKKASVSPRATWTFVSDDGTIGNGRWERRITTFDQGQHDAKEVLTTVLTSRVIKCKRERLQCSFCYCKGGVSDYGCAIALTPGKGLVVDVIVLKASNSHQLRATRSLIDSVSLVLESDPVDLMAGRAGVVFEIQRVRLDTLGTPLTLSYKEDTRGDLPHRSIEVKISGDTLAQAGKRSVATQFVRLVRDSEGPRVDIFYKNPPVALPHSELPLIHSAILLSVPLSA